VGTCPHCGGTGRLQPDAWEGIAPPCPACSGTGMPNLPHTPDEGAPVSDADFEALSPIYDALTPEGKAWFVSLVDQARQAGVSFHGHKSTGKRTERRLEIYRGLLALAGWTADQETRRTA
jgi:hypothetical protein